MKIAICTTNYNAYSETFIQAHKNLLQGEVLFYNTGLIPTMLERTPLKSKPSHFSFVLKFFNRTSENSLFIDAALDFYHSLQKEKPDVILAEFALVGAEVYQIAEALHIPLVIHCHGMDVSHTATVQAYQEKYKKAFAYAKFVIGVSQVMCRTLETLGCPKEKIVYTCCGPNANFFQIAPNYSQQIAFAIGRFVEKKAPHLTITAFAEALKIVPNARLVMAGDGPLFSQTKQLAKELKIEKAVDFIGVIQPQQVMENMQTSRFFVQHSVTAKDGDMEGTPVGILEAQAAGLPVVSTIHAGIPDIVIHNETGLLCSEGDVDTMATHMIQLFESAAECSRMGSNARKRMLENFTMDKHIRTLQDVLHRAIL